MCLGELVINPHQQHMDAFYWVIDWEGMISVSSLVGLLEKHFFPKWLQVRFVSLCWGCVGDREGVTWVAVLWPHREDKLHGEVRMRRAGTASEHFTTLLDICHAPDAVITPTPHNSPVRWGLVSLVWVGGRGAVYTQGT